MTIAKDHNEVQKCLSEHDIIGFLKCLGLKLPYSTVCCNSIALQEG